MPAARFLALLVLLVVGATRAADDIDPRVWLEPCDAALTNDPDDLERRRRLLYALELDESPFLGAGNHVARLIVEPSFAPEWVVTVFRPEDQPCAVVSTVADRNVLYANQTEKHGELVLRRKPASVTATTKRIDIPCELADLLGLVWSDMLRRHRIPESGDPMYVDGTRYTATTFKLQVGDLCGTTHVPPVGSPAAKMVGIGEALFELANADVEQQKRLQEKIRSLAQELLTLMGEESESSN